MQAGQERRGSNASQAVECCLEQVVEQIFARSLSTMLCTKRSPNDSRPLLLLRKCQECQEEKDEEETVKMEKSKAEPVSSWCHSCQACQAGSIKLHQRAVRSLIFLVYRVYLVKAEVQKTMQERPITISRTALHG